MKKLFILFYSFIAFTGLLKAGTCHQKNQPFYFFCQQKAGDHLYFTECDKFYSVAQVNFFCYQNWLKELGSIPQTHSNSLYFSSRNETMSGCQQMFQEVLKTKKSSFTKTEYLGKKAGAPTYRFERDTTQDEMNE